ncbi:MAG: dihydromonapterin reductase [Gammaproteobacteria bacterium]|nr:dihydromonapterin reductase [Gammaproteobacteria bacterium]
MSSEPLLITGIARRVGLHLAHTFLDRGIPVIGTYRTARTSLAELEQKGAELYQCDFDNEAQTDALIASIKQKHSSLRAIIHNASDWLPEHADLPSSEIMRRMMQVHVSAPYQLNLALEPLLKASESNYADIIHVGDYVSSRGSKKHIAYAASKAAQDNLTQSFAAKLAPKVKVNSLAPALVIFNPEDDEDYRRKALDKSLMQREGGLDEFQHAIDYLLQSQYVTGRVLPMDGGRHLR